MRGAAVAALALAAVVLGACRSARPVCEASATGRSSGSAFLWRATAPGKATLWITGTLHHLGAADIRDETWHALARADRFVSEVGDLEPDDDRIRALVRMPAGQRGLQQRMADDDWWGLRDALRGVIREDDLKRMRAWYAMARLRATAAPPPSPTMDIALTERAAARAIPIIALERPDEQLATLADTVTVADLVETLHERDTLPCRLADLARAYRAGDAAELERRLVLPQMAPLLGPRNARWLRAIQQIDAPPGSHLFVAVGLGHLLGADSLLALLRRAGYHVAESGIRDAPFRQ